MRKAYAKFAEETAAVTTTTTSTNQATPSTMSTSVSNISLVSSATTNVGGDKAGGGGGKNELEIIDPFYDRFPWFRLIGRGLMFLQNLLVPCPVTQNVCIVNEKGDVMGYLRIAIKMVTGMRFGSI